MKWWETMSYYEILSTDQKSKWIKLVEQTPYKDIFFLPEYLSLLAEHMNASGNLFFYKNGDSYILYPFLKRKINDITFISENISEIYWDIISPWYYGGPLFYGGIKKDSISAFLSELSKYCKKENIISEFSRFHPYLDNHKKIGLSNKFEKKIGTVVWVDLTKDLDYIFNQSLQKRCRTAIRKSEKEGVNIHINNEEKYLKTFNKLYLRAMDAMGTSDFYYFTNDFLFNLKRNLNRNFILITVEYKDKIVGGSIFLHKYDRMYYYLSARDPKHDKINASSRIIYEAIKYGKQKGIKFLDLGGGPEESGLLAFKKSFSDKTKELYGYKKIYNKEKYQKICEMAGLDKNELEFESASFFPEYRKGG